MIVAITGATSGIGQAAAAKLAGMGARILLIARDAKRAETTLQRLRQIAPQVRHKVYLADLFEMSQTARVAAEIAAAEPRIDVLVNNAGAMFGSRQLTREGLERTFALNHLSCFILTLGLLDRLKASAPARIITTSSEAHRPFGLDFSDLQSQAAYRERGFLTVRYGGSAFKVYGRSKLYNILFTRALARRLRGTAVTANCFHPGFVATAFADQTGGFTSTFMRFAKRFARPVEKGAETLVYLASSPQAQNLTGQYFYDLQAIAPSAIAQDDQASERLWNESEKLLAGILR